jgi:hypothetical protein
MLRRVAPLRTDVSEERITFNIRVKRIRELDTAVPKLLGTVDESSNNGSLENLTPLSEF